MLLKWLIFSIAGYLIYRKVKSWLNGPNKKYKDIHTSACEKVDDVMIKDPVCETYIPQRNAVVLNDSGKIIYFCSGRCRDSYIARKSKN